MKTLVLRKNLSVFLALVLLMSFSVYTAPRAEAAVNNFVVDTVNWTADANAGDDLCADSEGDCSLRAALEEANADGVTTAITFDAALNGLTITYDANVPAISAPVEITGPGAENLTLDCGTAPAPNAINFTDGGNGSSVTGGFTIENCIGAGQGIIGVRSDTTISDIEMDGAGVIEVHVDGNVDNVNISDNTLTGGAYIQLAYATYELTNSTISGNSIADATDNAINGYISEGTTINTNIISDAGGDGINVYIEAGATSAISGNTISGSTGNGISISNITADSTGVEVNDNIISTSGNDGLFLNSSPVGATITFDGNDVSDSARYNFYLKQVQATVVASNNTFDTSGDDNVYINGGGADADITLNTNTITAGTSENVAVNCGTVGTLLITGNTITDGSADGVEVYCGGEGTLAVGDLTITANTITSHATGSGIVFDDGSGDGTADGTFDFTTTSIDNNDITGAQYGMLFQSITAGNLNINTNTVTDSTSYGVIFQGVGENFIFDSNNISGSANEALYITNATAMSGLTVSNNTIQNNDLSGIDINSARLTGSTFDGNTVSGNDNHGVKIEDIGGGLIAGGNTFSNNTISDNTQNGILHTGNNGVIFSDNTITDNGSVANPGAFLANFFLYTYDGNEYDNGDDPTSYMVSSDFGSFEALEFIDEDNATLTFPDGTNNFNLAFLYGNNSYLAVFIDAANIDSSEAMDAACEALTGDDCTVNLFIEDVFTANGEADYTYDAAAVAAADVIVSAGSAPAWTFEEGGYDYYGVRVTGDSANSFDGETLTGNGNGFYFGSSVAPDNSISNSTISSLDIDIETKSPNTQYLDNTTFSTYDVSNEGLLDVNYDARVRVTKVDATTIGGATVTATDVDDVTTAMGTTDGTGYTSYTSLDAYQIDNTGIINNKNDYSFLASASRFNDKTTVGTVETPNLTIEVSLVARGGGGSGGSAKEKTLEEGVDAESSVAPFGDILNHWAKEFIEKLFEKGIIDGYENGTFGPDDGLTRAQLAKIAVRLFGIEIEENLTEAPFVDVTANAWYAPFVKAAVDNHFAYGYEDNTFHPDDLINRADALRMLFDAAKIDVSAVTEAAGFPDVAIDAWYARYVAYGVKNKIIDGYEDGTFGPDNNLTRGEIAKIAIMLLKHLGL